MDSLTLSLISHTNVGKTTLARTLLRRDVGDTGDRPHVTDASSVYDLIDAGGEKLCLWDTPGFGDTAKLVKRLRSSDKPFAWLRSQVWDRFADRPLWCSQEAVKNVREEADVVLYLVNAAEDPGSAGYVELEMEVLSWIGKPVVVLLNQTGPVGEPGAEDAEAALWREHVAAFEVVKEVLGLDAFTRCWVQEAELFKAVARAAPADLKPMAQRLSAAWDASNEAVFEQSVMVLEEMLDESEADRVAVSEETLLQKFWIGRGELNREMKEARKVMAERLAERFKGATDRLIELHGLEGESARRMAAMSEENFAVPGRVSESLWSAVGGATAGATGGLMADLAQGGMSFGGGAVLGGIGGGAASYLLAKGLNLAKGKDHSVGWTAAHLREQAKLAVLSYLAVAHFGRGRGEWQEGELPDFWIDLVGRELASEAALGEVLRRVLQQLYPSR